MCGIIGYVGKKKCIPIIIDGLKALEYRGYDSAGIATIKNNKINIVKEKGKLSNLEKKLDFNDSSTIGIGHTRWATHGKVTIKNAHPHTYEKITLVHNGIIENYLQLKEELTNNGYKFYSDTDTLIACAYINYLYSKNKDMLKTLTEITKIFKGSYSFGIINTDYNDTLFAVRKDSPLIIAKGKNENFISSDIRGVAKYTNKYMILDNYDIAILTKDDIKFYNNSKEITKETLTFVDETKDTELGNYKHYMLKEIEEQDVVLKNLMKDYKTKELIIKNIKDISKFKKIDIVGCGSAYHAGLIGKYLIEEYGNTCVDVHIASEYRYKKLFLDKDTLVILISQSGETADTLASLRIAKEHGATTLGIINVFASSIAREADEVIYIKAGTEKSVATTKAYLLQSFILSLLAIRLGIEKKVFNDKELNKILKDMNNLPKLIKEETRKSYKDLASTIYKNNDAYFLGRNIDYATSMEGSLKLKEISYIHAESYAAGELKHGTISLIDKNTLVIATVTKDTIIDKTISNIKEVKARDAYVVLITNKDNNYDCYDKLVLVNNTHPIFQPLINIIPHQLLSYEIASLRGCDIDKPRNLAKSVTVE